MVGAAFGEKLTVDNYLRAPFLTGRIVALNGKPVDRKAIAEKERWAYDNDISISAIGAEPPAAEVIEG